MNVLRRLCCPCRVNTRTRGINTGHRSVAALQRSSDESPNSAWRQSLSARNLPFRRTRRATTLSRDKKPETSCPRHEGVDGVSFNRDGGGARFWARLSLPKQKRRRGALKCRGRFRATPEPIVESPDSLQVLYSAQRNPGRLVEVALVSSLRRNML